MRSPISTAIAIAVGLIILLGYFLPLPALANIRSTMLDWAIILAAIAGLVALINLAGVHLRKMRAPKDKDVYSPFLLVAFALTFLAGVVEYLLHPSFLDFNKVVTSIQMPVEASLMAVLAVGLAYASFRFFQRRKGLMPVVFAISALVFLLLASGVLFMGLNTPIVNNLTLFLNRLPLAGARGILLGVALGSLTAGLRVLMGADRPYSG